MVVNSDVGSSIQDWNTLPKDMKASKDADVLAMTTSVNVAESLIDTEVIGDASHKDPQHTDADISIRSHKPWFYVVVLCIAMVAHAISTTVIFPFASFMVCNFILSCCYSVGFFSQNQINILDDRLSI